MLPFFGEIFSVESFTGEKKILEFPLPCRACSAEEIPPSHRSKISVKMSAAVKKLLPLLDRVLIRRAEAVTKTAGGIVIPEKAQGKVLHGEVIAVGQGARGEDGKFIPLIVKAGDKVLLPEYGGTKVNLDNDDKNEYHLFREADILAKIEN